MSKRNTHNSGDWEVVARDGLSINSFEISIISIISKYIDQVDFEFLVDLAEKHLSGNGLDIAKALIALKFPHQKVALNYLPTEAVDAVARLIFDSREKSGSE